jgi:simple sugar transport system substrate-binding protein
VRKLGGYILGAIATVLVVALPANADAGSRIVFVTHGQAADPYWSVVKRGVDDAAALVGAEVEYLAPETFDVVRMAQMIDLATASKPDGLVVSIPDVDALGEPIRAAIAGGIPVIGIDSGGEVAEELGLAFFMGQSEYDAGVAAGERMTEAGVKRAICVIHEIGNAALNHRCEGFTEGMEGLAAIVEGNLDPTETRSRILAHLMGNPATDGILTLGTAAAEAALAAVEEAEKSERIKIGTFDLSPAVLAAIDAGKMLFAIDAQQYMMGYYPVLFLDLHAKHGMMPAGDVPTGPGFVTRDTAASVMEGAKKGLR